MQLQIRQIEQNITLPVQQLENELEQIDLEHLEETKTILCSDHSCDDIRLLIRIYNSMLVKIQTQLKEQSEHMKTKLHLQQQKLLNLQMNDELRKSQLANLQAQINPHFLFNTLNMIAQSAYLKNDHHTVSLLETTSDLLRYALDYSDKAVPLKNEIHNLGNYVYLQEQRFGSRIRFRFDLDESFHHVLVPNFILQPLVENAIIHGINMYTEGGEILVRTEYDPVNQMGKISVIDNGEGMDEVSLKKVERQMRSKQIVSGKIGLSNVYLRLSIFFHQNAAITLSSIPRKQTEITIHIPCSLEELKKGDMTNV